MERDIITLIVPATPKYARTVRVTASELASRSHLSYEGVDEVRIAAEELFVYASDCADSGEVCMVFDKGEDTLEIRVSVGDFVRDTGEEDERRATYATFILQAVCDRFEMYSDETGAHLKVVKNLPAEPEDAVD